MHDRQTEVWQIDASKPDEEKIKQAAALLRQGGVVVFPTETVYGLGADTLQPQAVERIFVAKGRPYSDPLIVHIAEEADLETVARNIPDAARVLAQACWPGPLTLILPAHPRIPQMI